jgi:hypothetical protein
MTLFVQWTDYTSQTGPVEFRALYACEHCGGVVQARVDAQGSGSATAFYDPGGQSATHQQAAQHAAYSAASAAGGLALSLAPCPSCGRVPGSSERALAEAAGKERRRLLLAKYLVAVGAGLTALAMAYPAVREWRYSASLLVVGLALATLVPCIAVLPVALWRGGPIHAPNARVFFWLSRESRSGTHAFDWQEATLRTQARAFGHWVSGVALALIVVSGLVGAFGLLWYQSDLHAVQPAFVVSTAAVGTHVEVDANGRPESGFVVEPTNDDVFSHNVSVSKRGDRRITITVDGSPAQTRELPPTGYGWIVAPNLAASGLCLVEQTVFYGKNESEVPKPITKALAGSNDVYVLEKQPDALFQVPIKAAVLDRYTSAVESRRVLRALKCTDVGGAAGPPR